MSSVSYWLCRAVPSVVRVSAQINSLGHLSMQPEVRISEGSDWQGSIPEQVKNSLLGGASYEEYEKDEEKMMGDGRTKWPSGGLRIIILP